MQPSNSLQTFIGLRFIGRGLNITLLTPIKTRLVTFIKLFPTLSLVVTFIVYNILILLIEIEISMTKKEMYKRRAGLTIFINYFKLFSYWPNYIDHILILLIELLISMREKEGEFGKLTMQKGIN